MKLKNKLSLLLLAGLIVVISLFISTSYSNFKLQENFTALPLKFNPNESSSTYNWDGAKITIEGGFVKGKLLRSDDQEDLLLRALTPMPTINLKANNQPEHLYRMQIENVAPGQTLIKNVAAKDVQIIDAHTILVELKLKPREEKIIQLVPKDKANTAEVVILGDNRDGYQTFAEIIQQINQIKPLFVIDNGDLVFGGEPNKYRLFYETVSKLQVPLYTTLGNHDIREGGRPIYTELFGPPYYSFDYQDFHFIFLDSSRGWSEKQAIPEVQYRWLEADLKKAQGKRIFVISHIPPTDPRENQTPNHLPDIPGVEKTNYFEDLMNHYSLYKTLSHGFPTKAEATRFENLMSKYQVDTVFLSHIHSYYSYMKGNVHYIISGGAGAELLSTDSYYHYLRIKLTKRENYLEMVQLPSPTTTLQDRYLAAGILFAKAIYKEYQTTVFLILLFTIGVLLWVLASTYVRWFSFLKFMLHWLWKVLRFAKREYRVMKE